ncbi:hypothetical protein BATDEDRAFT_91032 [Batrachochytrium dendrobatidis JAM81]|uniref:U6 small nuclear RNA (adenine-(43)-N(6))-methyltransferase n=1 Tax=Batrachochytrium dendrobatidis (strain JAM81 / FGSC 10211) TaxID=684364 RepID=F4P8N8_BATDJ|nr:uncharacterized protein BATDEDRAFT_91032 [Batrachochytrium dendrobatidis JAM81]EGF78177.1 hypothetical protein BATDEDRAFT_91032 [Batrachochytrium dendrobatidis JAM81]|eukprot:XP_006681223.1 hypothetical protein BATDEDRAFT_91032 [Batrachochytrium dendrobatidis JAM81]
MCFLSIDAENLFDSLRKTRTGSIIEFGDPKAVRELTCALLFKYFGLRLEIPLDSLCPPVPNRLDYILHIEDLLSESNPSLDATVRGIDIGTGASCIYPLLGCSRNPKWSFLALEIDERSIDFATQNVNRNSLQNCITVVKGSTQKPIISLPNDNQMYDFCMCNPPFYSDEEEMRVSRSIKQQAPLSLCMGSQNEMLQPGGEVAFVTSLIEESQILGCRITWYTSLVGFRENAQRLEALLHQKQIPVVRRAVYKQGRTSRSILTWSFRKEFCKSQN